jgi:hypothetical protein
MTDRGPNGQVRIDGANRRTFPIPTFSPMILRVKTEGETIRILETLPILGQSGKSVSGISNIKGYDETRTTLRGKTNSRSIPAASIRKVWYEPRLENFGSSRNTAHR